MSNKFTIVRGTIFAGEAVEPGTVIEPDEIQLGQARLLVSLGKAVEGEVKMKAEASNKAAKVEDKK